MRIPKRPEVRAVRELKDELALLGVLDEVAEVCASYNWCIAEALRIKAERALDSLEDVGVRSLVVAGGVAANSMIRQGMAKLAVRRGLDPVLPELGLCTDNGAMIALAGGYLLRAGYCHGLDLEAIPRGRKIPWDYQRLDGGDGKPLGI